MNEVVVVVLLRSLKWKRIQQVSITKMAEEPFLLFLEGGVSNVCMLTVYTRFVRRVAA